MGVGLLFFTDIINRPQMLSAMETYILLLFPDKNKIGYEGEVICFQLSV